jgi:hypothetical protein
LKPFAFLRELWNTGFAQLLILAFSPLLILQLALALSLRLTGGAGLVAAHGAVDLSLSVYLILAMAAVIFISASGATRMRTLFETTSPTPGSWAQMLAIVAMALCAVLFIVVATETVRGAVQNINEHAGPDIKATWTFQMTRLMLAVWALSLGYRFKLIWDALTTHLDEFEAVKWKFGVKSQTLRAQRDGFGGQLIAMLATERHRRGLEPRAYTLTGLTREELIESALQIAHEMPAGPDAAKAHTPRKPRARPSRKPPRCRKTRPYWIRRRRPPRAM